MGVMATLKYRVILGEEEREGLHKRIRSGHDSARVLMRARVLLKADEEIGETAIAQVLEIHPRTVQKVRQRFFQGGLECAHCMRSRNRVRSESSMAGRRRI